MKEGSRPLFLLMQRHRRRRTLGAVAPSDECMEPLTSGEHLRELGSDRWVDCASGWSRSIAGLLVEADSARPSAEFVHFDYLSGGTCKSGNDITYSFLGKPNCTLSRR